MKNYTLILILIFFFALAAHAQQKPGRLSMSAGFGRAAKITSSEIRRDQFNISLALSYKLTKKFSLVTLISQPFADRVPNLRLGISYKIF